MKYTWVCKCCDGDLLVVERSLSKYDRKPLKRERMPWCEGKGWERVMDAPAIRNGDGFKAAPLRAQSSARSDAPIPTNHRNKK